MSPTSKTLGIDGFPMFLALLLPINQPLCQTVEPPPVQQYCTEKGDVQISLSLPGVHGVATYYVQEKEVSIEWFFRTASGTPRSTIETYAVPFWPTEVSSFGINALLVGGTNTLTGGVIVERWDLTPPSAIPQPFISPQTGQLVQPKLEIPVRKKTLVHTSDDSRGNIRLLMKRQGATGTAFVQFWGQRDLFSLDTATGQLAKIFAAHPDGLIPVIPGLSEVSKGRWSRKHKTQGYVYYLGEQSADGAGLFLIDEDLDGGIDESGSLSWEEFWARKLDRALEFEAWY